MNMTRFAAMALLTIAIVVCGTGQSSAQSCGVTISNMNFGPNIDTLSSSPVDTTAELQFSCSGWPASERILICVHLGEGSVASGGGARRMEGGGNHLLYQLYQNPERSIVWGSANMAASIAATAEGTGAVSGTRMIYGRVPGGQSTAAATTYSSTFSGADVEILYRAEPVGNDCATGSGSSGGAANFDVEATVAQNCIVSTAPVNFGSHGALNANIDATGTVYVTCTLATNYAIRLDGGGAAAAPTARRMAKGSDSITYGLYRNIARDQPWGDAEETRAHGTGSGSVQSHTVYGRVAPQTTPPTGVYTDTVVVIVDY
ncbi:spore coat U domain-containing protein [Hyphomicrobium sp. CS1BSMeth3]|uniref:Csu type fimbrial protein n=1 Tax=Hyphomicrobium sp. CS1BSMeth3 TaxID=1892844 RepID=UPI001FCD585C|nr:spore coat U domain-containing protein [Hyphomicrobium sp. CS1BSMeth3]